jgi:hypothetical protein
LQPALTNNEPDTFGGLWIQHEPEYKGVVAFTQDGESLISKYTWYIPEEVRPYIEIRQVANSLSRLISVQNSTFSSLRSLGINSSSMVDVINNRININICKSDQIKFENISSASLSLPDMVKINYVDSLATPLTNIYAGLSLFGQNEVGTTGFGVADGAGNRYIVTAGHLYNTDLSWNSNNIPYISNPGYVYGGSYDCELRGSGGFDITNQMQWWQDGSTLNVTATQSRFQIIVGSIVSKYGTATHWSCGQIVSIYGYPTNGVPNPNPTWIAVCNIYNLNPYAFWGDSGGPWYTPNGYGNATAYGITGSTEQNYSIVWFMSVDYFAILGVYTLTQ